MSQENLDFAFGSNRYRVFFKDSRDMSEIGKGDASLVITSPPYNVGFEYEKDILTDGQYVAFLADSLREIYRILQPDGRFCWNVSVSAAREEKKDSFYRFSPMELSLRAIRKTELKIENFIIWDKGEAARGKTCWGSWMSASSPHIINTVEVVIVGYKDRWAKKRKDKDKLLSSIPENMFMANVKGIWKMIPETQEREHPAPFPLELPYRCIQSFSYTNDLVVDPFLGTGTTMLAAKLSRRDCDGYEKYPMYKSLIIEKCSLNQKDLGSFLSFDQDNSRDPRQQALSQSIKSLTDAEPKERSSSSQKAKKANRRRTRKKPKQGVLKFE